jgi:hypothetical protein
METITKRFDRIAAKAGKEAAIERARAYVAGLILGRDFMESVESYRARKPALREIESWLSENAK